jgi:polar amino acid transport system substrate-binding protein
MRAMLSLVCATAIGFVLAATSALAQNASAEQKAQIVPTGVLRAALVKIPFLAKQDPASGQLRGVAPDLGEEFARRLGLPYQSMPFDSPNAGIAALRGGLADITFLAPTPERVALIDFGPAFMEMEMTLIVPGGSPIQSHADADQPGRRIVAYERTAVDEMLMKKMTKATIVRVPIFGYKQAFELIKAGQADAFADLRDALLSYQPELPDSRIVPGNYGSNALAIGYAKERPLTAALVREFTAAAIASGFVTRAIEKAGVKGAVAPGS